MTKHTNSTLTPALSRTPLSTEISRIFSLRSKLSLVAGCALLLGQMTIATDVNALNVSELDGSNGFTLTGPSGFNRLIPTVIEDINGDGVDEVVVTNPSWSGFTSFIVFGRQGNAFPAEVDLNQLDGTKGFKVEGNLFGSMDINHDGNTDLIFQSDSGSQFVVYGQQANGQFPAVIDQSQMNGSNGFRISDPEYSGFSTPYYTTYTQGDVSGDGIDDILVMRKTSHNSSVYGYYRYDASLYVIFGQDNVAVNNGSADFILSQTNGKNGFHIQNLYSHIEGLRWRPDVGMWLSDKRIDINGDGINDVFLERAAVGASFLILDPLSEGGEFPAIIENLPNSDIGENFITTPLGLDAYQAVGDYNIGRFNIVGDINGDSADDLFASYDEDCLQCDIRVNSIALGDHDAVAGDDHLGDINFVDDPTSPSMTFGDGFPIGDVNGDGIDDVLIENEFQDGVQQTIDAFILFGRDSAIQGDFPEVIDYSYFDGNNGVKLSGTGSFISQINPKTGTTNQFTPPVDINADGINDIVWSSWNLDSSNLNRYSNEAQTIVVYGRKTAFPATLSVDDLGPSDGFIIDGFSASSERDLFLYGGDVNADGADDIVIGTDNYVTYSFPQPIPIPNSVYVVYGQPSPSKPYIVPILDLLLNDEPGGSQP